MQNNWIIFEDDYIFGEWRTTLNFPDEHSIYTFLREWLNLGAECGTWTLTADEHFDSFAPDRYISDLQTIAGKDGLCHFLKVGNVRMLSGIPFNIWYNLGHYDSEGVLVRKPVMDAGEILRSVNPVVERRQWGYAGFELPVRVFASPINLKQGCPFKTTLYIRLKSNLFFPQVASYLGPFNPEKTGKLMLDNSAVADLNTPHLNDWLQKADQLCRQYGDGIRLGEQYGEFVKPYLELLSDQGILA